MASKRIDISINGKDNTKAAFTSTENSMKGLATQAKTIGTSIGTGISTGTKTAATSFNALKTSATSALSSIGSMATSAASRIASAFSGMGGIISSALAGLTASELVTSAAAAESKWGRIAALINETGKGTGITLENSKQLVNTLSEKYGVIKGEASATLETMYRFEGVSAQTNQNFEGMLATTKLTGKSAAEVYSAIQSGELGRAQAVKKGILTEQQRVQIMADGKITQEDINWLMQDNIRMLNENNGLVQDTESNWNRIMNDLNAIKITIGSALMPVISAMRPVIEGVANAFKQINDWSGGLLASFVGVGVAITAMGAPLAFAAQQVSSMAKSAWEYAAGMKAGSTATPAAGAAGGAAAGGVGSIAGVVAGIGSVILAGVAAWKISDYIIAQLNNLKANEQQIEANMVASWYRTTAQFTSFWTSAINSVIGAFSGLYSSAVGIAGSISGAFWGAANSIIGAFWSIPGAVSGAMSSAYSTAVGWANQIASSVSNIVGSVKNVVGMSGPRGPGSSNISQACGPSGPNGLSLTYQNYAGTRQNAWNASGSGLTGNCVDMTLGLMSAYGGKMVSGTWNGGPHVWWQAPNGKQMDPARKALEGTWNPPARGPGNGGNIIIPVSIGGEQIQEIVVNTVTKEVYDARRF